MVSRLWLLLAIGGALILAGTAEAVDIWDAVTVNGDDDAAHTANELFHGVVQVHDLAAQSATGDSDWYLISQKPYSSYEVVVDYTDVVTWNFTFAHVASDETVLHQRKNVGVGYAKYVGWMNLTGSTYNNQYILVADAACGTTCTETAQYTIRTFETTVAVPRFNNAGTQITVLLCQNPTNATINGGAYFWNSSGTLLGSSPFTLTAKQALVLNTTTVTGLSGQSGTITIPNDGRYGDLACKSVALEPSTGFSFDSPGVVKPM